MNWDGKATVDFTDMLQQVAGNGTGSLEVRDVTGERRGWVFLQDHDVVAVLVDGYQPRLGRRLATSGFVSSADMDQLLTVVKDEYDPRIAVECVARGLVDAATIEVLYREFMLSAASSVNEWDVGEYHWVAGATPWEGRSAPVSVPALVSAMARRQEHWTQLWTNMSADTIPDRIPVRTSRDGEYTPDSPCESAVLAAVDGKRTVDQVAGECGFTRFQAGHLLSGLMAKRVLDLLPAESTRPVPDCLPVEAGYYAPSKPLPGEGGAGASAPEPEPAVHSSGQPPEPVAPRHSWVVPLAVQDQGDPLPPVIDPSLGEFFASAEPGPLALLTADRSDGPDPERATQHLVLPPLPAMTGGPSDFYIDLPASRPAEPPALELPALEPPDVELPALEPPAVELSAETAPKAILTNLDSHSDAVTVEPETATGASSEVGSDAEVAQLREDLLRMAAERAAALDKAVLLRALAATHSAEAADAAARAEEDGRSISRLSSATSEASANAQTQLEGLRLAQAEVARVGEIKARAEADAETAGKTLVIGQGKFDEASAAQTVLQRDLQAMIARQEAANDEWTAAHDGAARSEANAKHAEATVIECDQLMSEARERLTALAVARR